MLKLFKLKFMRGIIHWITGAPWWASALLAYLLYIGWKATKPQTIWLPRLFIVPIILTGLFLMNLWRSHVAGEVIVASLAGLIVGSIISWLISSRVQFTFDKPQLCLHLPG